MGTISTFVLPCRSGCLTLKKDLTLLGVRPVALVGDGVKRLSTDPIGTFTLVLKNAVVGSRYRIARQGDNSLATPTGDAEGTVPGVSGLVDVSITLDLYSVGNTNNDLKIDVRKGTTAPKYKPFQTFAAAQTGTVTAYCAQESDPIA